MSRGLYSLAWVLRIAACWKQLYSVNHIDLKSLNTLDFEDVIHCGRFLDQEPVACSVREKPLYDPSLHHVAPVTWRQVETMPVEGQFDDAVDWGDTGVEMWTSKLISPWNLLETQHEHLLYFME